MAASLDNWDPGQGAADLSWHPDCPDVTSPTNTCRSRAHKSDVRIRNGIGDPERSDRDPESSGADLLSPYLHAVPVAHPGVERFFEWRVACRTQGVPGRRSNPPCLWERKG